MSNRKTGSGGPCTCYTRKYGANDDGLFVKSNVKCPDESKNADERVYIASQGQIYRVQDERSLETPGHSTLDVDIESYRGRFRCSSHSELPSIIVKAKSCQVSSGDVCCHCNASRLCAQTYRRAKPRTVEQGFYTMIIPKRQAMRRPYQLHSRPPPSGITRTHFRTPHFPITPLTHPSASASTSRSQY
jgi:hypothetical protein